jgi:hypothetical protein
LEPERAGMRATQVSFESMVSFASSESVESVEIGCLGILVFGYLGISV